MSATLCFAVLGRGVIAPHGSTAALKPWQYACHMQPYTTVDSKISGYTQNVYTVSCYCLANRRSSVWGRAKHYHCDLNFHNDSKHTDHEDVAPECLFQTHRKMVDSMICIKIVMIIFIAIITGKIAAIVIRAIVRAIMPITASIFAMRRSWRSLQPTHHGN
jgi:hypothetical protein